MDENTPVDEQAIFLEALARPDLSTRTAYLDQVCPGDSDLRHGVELLLKAHEQAGAFLQIEDKSRGDMESRGEMELRDECPASPGRWIGSYRLVYQIGEGGMGVVYLAEQVSPVVRRVALKLIKPGMDTGRIVARFEAERQTLAMMDHPHISKVLDAGATEEGRPYFVMELVQGIPITQYCQQKRLSLRERLDLFLPICDAVQHAHRKGIIHRDLKPGNILVSERDGRPMPRVIDFGVAKAIGSTCSEETAFTREGQIIGTLEYMSPEQAQFRPMDVDTRSDVYSLGVLLYELLTGRTPFDGQRFRSLGFEEMLRIIREEDPPRPSVRLSSVAGESTGRSAGRSPSSIIPGELDWIVLRALEKERSRRYQSASALAEDLQNYLNDEAVVACPPSAAYRLRKFARRHETLVAAAVAVLAVVVLGLAGTSWQAVRATRAERSLAREVIQEQRARREADAAKALAQRQRDVARRAEQRAKHNFEKAMEAVNQLLQRVGHESLAHVPLMEEVRRDLLEDALLFFDEFLQGEGDAPGMRHEMGVAYWRTGRLRKLLGDYSAAEEAFREAISILAELAKRQPDEREHQHFLGHGYEQLAELLADQGRHDEAREAYLHAHQTFTKLVDEHPLEGRFVHDLGQTHHGLGRLQKELGEWEDAEVSFRAALACLRSGEAAELPIDERENSLMKCRLALAKLLVDTGRETEAEPEYLAAAEFYRERVRRNPHLPGDRQSLAFVYEDLGHLYKSTSRHEQAEVVERDGLAIRRELARDFPKVGVYRKQLADNQINLGVSLLDTGEYREAASLFSQAAELSQELVEEDSGIPEYEESLGLSRSNFAVAIYFMQQYEAAREHLVEAAIVQRDLATRYPDSPEHKLNLGRTLTNLGAALHDAGRIKEAESAYAESVDVYRALVERRQTDARAQEIPEHLAGLGNALLNLASLQSEIGRAADAIQNLRAVERIAARLVEAHPQYGAFRNLLVKAYLNQGSIFRTTDRSEAERSYRAAIENLRQIVVDAPHVPEYPREMAFLWSELAELHQQANQIAEARQCYVRAIAVCRQFVEKTSAFSADVSHDLAKAHFRLGILLTEAANLPEAERAFQSAITIQEELVAAVPQNSHYFEDLANSYTRLGVAQDAAGELPDAKKSFAKAATTWEELVNVHEHGADFRIRWLESQSNHAILSAKSGELESAIHTWESVLGQCRDLLRESPDASELAKLAAEIYLNLGSALREAGRRGEAEARLREGVALTPDNPRLLNHLAWFLAIGPELDAHRAEDAIAFAERATELAPEDGSYWNTLGVARYQDSKWEAAIEALERGLEIPGDETADCLFLALASWKSGRHDDATRYFQQVTAAEGHSLGQQLQPFYVEARELMAEPGP